MNLDTDEIVAAIIACAANRNGDAWDLVSDYLKTIDYLEQQREEREHVRPS